MIDINIELDTVVDIHGSTFCMNEVMTPTGGNAVNYKERLWCPRNNAGLSMGQVRMS